MDAAMIWRQQRERGTDWGIVLTVWVARVLGRHVARIFVLIPLTWFFLTGFSARRASRDFLTRALGHPPSMHEQWRHFRVFADCALDRVFLLSGGAGFDIRVHCAEHVFDSARRGGALLLVAHFGNFEAMRVPGTRQQQLPISILMDRAHGRRFVAAVERLDPSLADAVIDVGEGGPMLALKLKEVLHQGRLVGVMADRARETEATVSVNFLGAPVRLPTAPWHLALVLGVPVILGFSIYRGDGCYDTYYEIFSSGLEAKRNERTTALQIAAQGYADRLAEYVRESPYNWFNFYDFWA